jgi:hypothetical protein
MLRDRLRIGPLLALGAVLVIGACGDPDDEALVHRPGVTGGWSTAGCELARKPESVAVGDLVLPATPADLDAAITRIDHGGRGDFADSYAGIEVDQRRVRAIVYRVPSEAFDDFIRQTAENACIVVRDAPYSTTGLAVWHDRVLADLPFWTNRGIRIVTIGARHDGSGVEIGTRDLDRARLELPARYGSRAPLAFVEQAPVYPLPTPTLPAATPPGG